MSSRFHGRHRRAIPCRDRIEELEGRALLSITASAVTVSEVEGQATIDLTILNLPGAVSDTASKPIDTFSNVQVVNVGEGTVAFTDTKSGTFTYMPPSST